jgi:hypothetical protein
MFSYIGKQTGAQSVVVFFKPRVMKLMTGRQSILVNRVGQLSRGDFLCLYLREDAYDQVTEEDLEPLIAKGEMHTVFENSDFKVYRIGSRGPATFWGGTITVDEDWASNWKVDPFIPAILE